MTRGYSFTRYKETLLSKMIEDHDLVQALTNNKPNFLEDVVDIAPESLLYKNIYPYMKTAKTLTETQSLIFMRFDRFKPIGNHFKEGNIYFYIICHNSLLLTNEGLRYDYIFDRVDALFNLSRDIGIGKLELFDVSDLTISDDYTGCVCAYHVTDFK